jgi:hypothetical protein
MKKQPPKEEMTETAEPLVKNNGKPQKREFGTGRRFP